MSEVAKEIMDVDEACRYLRIKKRTLYSLASRGLVPAAKVGGQWRFKKGMLDGLFASGAPPDRAALLPDRA
jgi:excisionase family DNA binding protein